MKAAASVYKKNQKMDKKIFNSISKLIFIHKRESLTLQREVCKEIFYAISHAISHVAAN